MPARVVLAATMGKILSKVFYYWLPAIFCGIFIFSVSSLPGKNIPEFFPYQDIVFHAGIYGVFALLISRLVKVYNPARTKIWQLLFVLGIIFVFALTDEFHQSFVPNRTASVLDIGIDCLGAVIAAFFYL